MKISVLLLALALALFQSPGPPATPPQSAPVIQPQSAPPPVFTKELFQQRIAYLEHQRDQMIANVNALDGAIQECAFWLKQLEEAEKKAKEEKKELQKSPDKKSEKPN